MAASPPQHIFMLQSNNDDSVTQQVLLTFTSSKKRGLQQIPIIKSSEDIVNLNGKRPRIQFIEIPLLLLLMIYL